MNNRFERFTFVISEIYRHLHRITSDEMQKYGLRGPYAAYLIALYQYDEGITATRLAEICNRNKADVSRAMATLEEKGLIFREGVGQNLYRAKLRLTEEGKQSAGQLHEIAAVAMDVGGQGLSDEKRAVFYEALELVATNMQGISRNGLHKQRKDEQV